MSQSEREPFSLDSDSRSKSDKRPDSISEGVSEFFNEPLRLVHHHPGYMRIQADAFMQPGEENSVVIAAQTAAEATYGFYSWSQNSKTGSVVVEYDPSIIEADEFLKIIAKGAGLQGVENSTSHKANRQELVSGFLDTVQDINQVVSQMTGERADLREVMPVVLAATSVVSFVLNDDKGRLPNWNSALYHSYRIFMQWHRSEVRTRETDARKREESDSPGRRSGNVP